MDTITALVRAIASTHKRYLDGCMSHPTYKSHISSLLGRARHLGIERQVATALLSEHGIEI